MLNRMGKRGPKHPKYSSTGNLKSNVNLDKRILLSNKTKWIVDTCNNVLKPQKQFGQWKNWEK